jgi:hypothetical protein
MGCRLGLLAWCAIEFAEKVTVFFLDQELDLVAALFLFRMFGSSAL